ncbi:MAG TPA: heme-binding domain-containing protein, partial [Puia sp.]|nr:heme-binding domain-containing protein [Puia sp.]
MRFTRKKVVFLVGFLLLLGGILQFFRPALDNSPATAELSAPVQVVAILQRACYDCHSNQTRLA